MAIGALSGAVAVALGAFGAHGLEARVPAADLDTWETAVHYHGLHSLALILFGLFAAREGARPFAGWAFLAGTAVFSGTLYGIVLGGPRWLGAITPIGGTAMIAGWLAFALAAVRR